MNTVQFFVEGDPATKGSTRSFITDHEWKGALQSRRKPRPVTIHDNKRTRPWQKIVTLEASRRIDRPHDGCVQVNLIFALHKPKKPSHEYPQGDVDKLTRCVLDALTGVAYKDDVQVVDGSRCKRYSIGVTGVQITIHNFAPGEWREYQDGG